MDRALTLRYLAVAACGLAAGHTKGDADCNARLDALEREVQTLRQQHTALTQRLEQLLPNTPTPPEPTSRPDRDALDALAAELESSLDTLRGDAALHATRDLLARGLDPEREGPSGWRPLAYAAERGHLPVLRELLPLVDLDARSDRFGETALAPAARAGQTASLQLLLDAGANPRMVAGPYPSDTRWAAPNLWAWAGNFDDALHLLDTAASTWHGPVGLLATLEHLALTPAPDLQGRLQVQLGDGSSRWGRVRIRATPPEPTLRTDQGPIPVTWSGVVYHVRLRWRLDDGPWTRRDLVVNQPNAGEDVLGAIVFLGPHNRSRLDLTLRPHFGD